MVDKKKNAQRAPKEGKRLFKAREGITLDTFYPLDDALNMVKERATAKFDETVEIAINLGIDVKKSDQTVRGVVPMPHGTGKSIRVAVLTEDPKQQEAAKKAKADLVGGEEILEEINKGNINFDRCIATPDFMPKISQVAKVLGPKGLMPNPKLGTVTANVGKAVEEAKAGQVEFRADKGGVIHAGIGKASFKQSDLLENLNAFVAAIKQAKPSGTKGNYIRKVTLTSTMGPSVSVDITSLAA